MCIATFLGLAGSSRTNVGFAGEPAESFVKQLRNAGYFDTAITYLDRVETMAGVDPSFVAAIELEKAQTFIDLALNVRSTDKRDQAFADAETSLQTFLDRGDHPRQSEARLQLGKLQMIRAAQLLSGDPDAERVTKARESYLAASETFDAIEANLREILEEMRGQKIDVDAQPELATRRDQYRFQFMQSKLNAADAITLAAKTFSDPAKQGKKQLDDALKRLQDLNKKYAGYIPGAIALVHLGEIYEMLGNDDAALDHFLRMLEEPDVDPLREAKYRAATGLIGLKLAEEPPKYEDALARTESFAKQIRPNEATSPAVQDFRIALAKAFLAKAADQSLKKGEIGRAKSDGRELLREASRVPGIHVEEAETLLADLGIEKEPDPLPTAEPPESFDDALEKVTQLYAAAEDLRGALDVLDKQKDSGDLEERKSDLESQVDQSYNIGVQILRGGLPMATTETNVESINQARQFLAYFLYQLDRHRETVVVGTFLARNAPGSDTGLKGGLMALTSMQKLLAEVPDDANQGLIEQLQSLGDYLAETWPDDPDAAAAQGMQIRLLLKKDDFEGAQALIDSMPAGSERAMFKRLLGQLLWNASIVARVEEKDDAKSQRLLERAKTILQQGLDEIDVKLIETEGMQAALVLAKIHLAMDDTAASLSVLDHPDYGPLALIKKLDPPSERFVGELYSSELKSLVGQMMSDPSPRQYLERMTGTMEQLRDAYKGPESQQKLTQTYMRLASDLKEQLDQAAPARRAKLIGAFQIMLKRIADATQDTATLRWVGQTLSSMGESSMPEGQSTATGTAAELISQAVDVFKSLPDQDDVTTAYLLGRSLRLVGQYKQSIDVMEALLKDKPLMLEAQIEAAQAYEDWAGTLKPGFAYKAYRAALKGARPNEKGKNTIWGWDDISQKTSKQIKVNDNFKQKFFESRYHVALCLYLMGKSKNRTKEIGDAAKVIRQVRTLFPDMGGEESKAKYEALLKQAEKES